MVIPYIIRTFTPVIKKHKDTSKMRKNYRVTIENGGLHDSFTLLGQSKQAVRRLCEIVHIGTGWKVKSVELAKKKEPVPDGQQCLF